MTSARTEERAFAEKSEKMNLAPVAPQSFRRAGAIERWRFWAPLAVVAFLLLWRGADSWLQDTPGRIWHSPGRLAAAHVLYDDQCAACHADFSPVSSGNWLAVSLGRTHAADAACMECHESSNHHNKEKTDRRPACTACHLEHRGREASLTRTPDSQCASCHADLAKSVVEGSKTTLANASFFDKGNHPAFGAPTDTRRLKFNHKLHLTPGMQRTEGAESFTLAKVDARYRTLYDAGARLEDPVRLQCKSCHQLDSRDFPLPAEVLSSLPVDAVQPPRPPGATMLPIVYEQHCQACHPLAFEAPEGTDTSTAGAIAPHRQQPSEIRRFLEAFYLNRLQKSRAEIMKQPFPPLPGRPLTPEQTQLGDEIAKRVQRAEQQLYTSNKVCGECHYPSTPPEKLPANRLSDLKIEPTHIPEVWYQKANFTHTPHRQLECLACHEGADTRAELIAGVPGPGPRPLLPAIDNCLNCHNSGGARQDCVACHRYHDGDNPLNGPGSAARAGAHAGTNTIKQFLTPAGR